MLFQQAFHKGINLGILMQHHSGPTRGLAGEVLGECLLRCHGQSSNKE